MSIEEQLIQLGETKNLIKNAIIKKGVEVDSTTPFREYASKISEITGGEQEIGDITFVNNSNCELLDNLAATNHNIVFTNNTFSNISPSNGNLSGYACLRGALGTVTLGNLDVYLTFKISKLLNNNQNDNYFFHIENLGSGGNSLFLTVHSDRNLFLGTWKSGDTDRWVTLTSSPILNFNEKVYLKVSLLGTSIMLYKSNDNGETYELVGTYSAQNFTGDHVSAQMSVLGQSYSNRKVFGTFYYNETKVVDRVSGETVFTLQRAQ